MTDKGKVLVYDGGAIQCVRHNTHGCSITCVSDIFLCADRSGCDGWFGHPLLSAEDSQLEEEGQLFEHRRGGTASLTCLN